MEDMFMGVGIEVRLPHPDDFLKVRETLTRVGVASKNSDILYQSCHILHKRGRYVILHFKELFILDGKDSSFTEEDLARRNTIANLLNEWRLVDVIDKGACKAPVVPVNSIKIVSFRDKNKWVLESKYTVGKKRSS